MKPFLKVCLSLATLVALSASAALAASARYRIDLRDGRQVLARDLPVRRGTIITFHEYPGGALTGLPQEVILRIEPGSARTTAREAAPRPERKLQGGVTNGLQPGDIIVVGPNNDGLKPGEILVLGPTGEGGASLPQPGASGVAGAAASGGSAAGAPAIGPNGTPVLAPPGAPGATPPNVGPNGTPIVAPPGAPGSAAPSTAPNGTPNAAPPSGSR